MAEQGLLIRSLGVVDYASTWQSMSDFTNQRHEQTQDEVWLVQHPPVFTLGQAGKREHLLNPGDIPVVACDRGGQVTYHGPGQMVAYPLLDLRRRKLGVRELVHLLEESLIQTLAQFKISGSRRDGAPGVYVDEAKIAALGLRVRRGCSFHGISLNWNMDLEPFRRINPCGYAGLQVIQMADILSPEQLPTMEAVAAEWINQLDALLNCLPSSSGAGAGTMNVT